MATLVLCFVLHIIVATVVRCDVKLQRIPSHHQESCTTFLRLTALRDDEGLWVARFGEYEVSIELKRQPKTGWRKTAEDTWTLKIKHKSRLFETKCNNNKEYDNNELPSERPSSTTNRGSWRKIVDGVNGNAEDLDIQMISKRRRSGKTRKGKSRLQVSPKPQIRRIHDKTVTPTGKTETRPSDQKAHTLKELVQGTDRLQFEFDRVSNDAKQLENTDEAFKEVHATPQGNEAALVHNATANHTTVENQPDQQTDQTEANSGGSSVNYEDETLVEPHALPLQQFEEAERPEIEQGTNSLEDANESKIVHEYNYNADARKSSEDFDTDVSDGRVTRLTTDRADDGDTSDNQQRTDLMLDYVIEDPTVRDYDAEGVRNEEQEDKHGATDYRQGDFEPTSEMRRIMDWFPRSRLLTAENNGYKLFPGVGWFKLITWPERWSNARRSCESEQAHLAIPDSRQKVRVLLQILQHYPDVLEQAILHRQVYVGVYSSGHGSNFSTVLGNLFLPEFPIWFPNEPDNADPGEDCVTLHAEGKLRDVPCFYNLPFLCEKHLDVPQQKRQ